MGWRPTNYLKEGELDNTVPGKVTGWIRFAGLKEDVNLDLQGDFHRDIRGAKIHFLGRGRDGPEAEKYMEGFSQSQLGKVGDMTAGLPPQDYLDYPYIEWYSEANGRIVVELEPNQVHLIGTPLPAEKTEPISRADQWRNMGEYLGHVAKSLDASPDGAACRSTAQQEKPVRGNSSQEKGRRMKLITREIRVKLPPLYAQEKLGAKAIAYLKLFTPDSGWTWYITEYDGKDMLFGLVDGQDKELGYVSLSELESVRGPMGLPIERDIHWQPRTLEEIAPEMFRSVAAAEH